MEKELLNSREGKAYDKAYRSGGFTLNQLNAALGRKAKIVDKYKDARIGAFLQDMGYENTAAGREYVSQMLQKK